MTKEDAMSEQTDQANLEASGNAGKSANTVETESKSTEPNTKKAPTDPTTKVINESDQAKTKQAAAEDLKANDERGDTTFTNTVDAGQQSAAVDAELDRRNRANEEGQQTILDAAERNAAEAHGKTAHPGYHTPTGKEDNRNTPTRIDPKTGAKTWG